MLQVVMPLKVNMRKIRLELGLTQDELAPKLKMKPSQLSQIENKRYLPSLPKALYFSKVLSRIAGKPITVHDIFELEKGDM
jgi:DNA-binding XRE family transcriptional regulator